MSTTKVQYVKLIVKLMVIMGFILSLNTTTANAEEKPLSTIGETEASSPFNQTEPAQEPPSIEETTPAEDINLETPFKAEPATTSKQKMPDVTQIKPESAQPQIENLKTTDQVAAKSLISDPQNKLGLAYPYIQLEQSKELLKKKDIAGAKAIVEPLSEWLTKLTEYHIELFKKLNSIDTAKNQAQIEKRLALDSALLRDKAYYQLALIYLGENNEKDAIKYFLEVIKSQPQTELGMKSYEILQQIGFTEKIRLVN